MKVGVVGINHKLADLRIREALAKICQNRLGSLTFNPRHHFVLLSTCNRTEVYFTSEDLADTHSYLLRILRQALEEEFEHKLYSYFGVDCFSHLTRVTTGLDSAIVGETEIQGQVKAAYEAATQMVALPKELHYLFQKSIGISKKVRTEFQLGRGLPNLEHAVYQTGKDYFKNIENPKILFVGASQINHKIMEFLKSKHLTDLTLCNRSLGLFNVNQLSWEALSKWPQFDWIIVGTKSPHFIIKKENILDEVRSPKLIMDLSVPRNVEPQIGHDPCITLFNIDQINQQLTVRQQKMSIHLTAAEKRIEEETQQQIIRYQRKEESKLILLAI